MNIVRENREDLTSLLKVTVSEADYSDAVEKKLREYRRKANVPGFRPGMVPMGIVTKMYGKSAVAEEAYHISSNACFKYIESEKINYIGDLMPSDEQKNLDFDNAKDFEFVFEFGVAPEVNIELSAKDVVTRYKIDIDQEMQSSYRTNFLRKYGRLVDVDEVVLDEAITGTLDNETMNVEDAYIGLISMSDEDRMPFIGKKVGDTLNVDLNELYKNPSQRAAILQMKEEELAAIDPKFRFTITKIRKFADPEMNEEFFKMAFPDGSVADEQALEGHIDSQIERELGRESEYLFIADMRKFLIDKANLQMPGEFLKKWLFSINEGKFTMDEIEKDFPAFIDMMRWNIIQKHYVKMLELNLTQEDILDEAKAMTLTRFAQYGMASLPDDMLSNYANQMLSNKEEANKIMEKLFEQKVIDAVAPLVKVSQKSVSVEEFGKIVDAQRR